MKLIFIALSIIFLGCALSATTNTVLDSPDIGKTKATFEIAQDRGNYSHKTLFVLAISGGGTRSAYWASKIMLALENVFIDSELNLLNEIDVISAVSGGTLPAAYYSLTCKDNNAKSSSQINREWNIDAVEEIMTRNYTLRLFGNMLWPTNIFRYFFTAYDRSDIMAQTFADNAFDNVISGRDYKFKDIPESSPYLIINSTIANSRNFSDIFTFTHEDFRSMTFSNINEYDISRAVMGSSAFPGAFPYMTLRSFNDEGQKYLHIFDGGNSDNLGVSSVIRILCANKGKKVKDNSCIANVKSENPTNSFYKYERVIVLLIDAFMDYRGVSSSKYDSRQFTDYLVDSNFLESSDCLLSHNRNRLIKELEAIIGNHAKNRTIFYHIKFNDIKLLKLRNRLNKIPTGFSINEDNASAIDQAVPILINVNNPCLNMIRDIIVEGQTNSSKYEKDSQMNYENNKCTWTN